MSEMWVCRKILQGSLDKQTRITSYRELNIVCGGENPHLLGLFSEENFWKPESVDKKQAENIMKAY